MVMSLARGWGWMEGEFPPEFIKMEGEKMGEGCASHEGKRWAPSVGKGKKRKEREKVRRMKRELSWEGGRRKCKPSPKEATLGSWVSQEGSLGISPFSKEGRRGTGGPSCPGGLWICCYDEI